MKKSSITFLLSVTLAATGFRALAYPKDGAHFINPLNYPQGGLSPAQERAYALWDEQQRALALQKQYEVAAARQKEWDSAIAKINEETRSVIEKLDRESSEVIADFKSQVSTLERRAKDLAEEKLQSEAKNNHLRAKQLFQPKDPWGMIDGKIYNAKDADWFQFTGRILEVKPNGIVVSGDFGPPLEAGFGKRKYFVENFPNETYSLADDETIEARMDFVAHMGGKTTCQFTNTTIDLKVETIRRLDYGKVVSSPPSELANKWRNPVIFAGGADSQIMDRITDNQEKLSAAKLKLSDAQSDYYQKKARFNAERDTKITDLPNFFARQLKEKQDAAKRQQEAKVIAYNQEQAEKGDPIALRRMGELYRDGNGVEKDPVKAAEFFKKADEAAATELFRLNKESKLRDQAVRQQRFMRNVAQAGAGNTSCMINVGKCYRDGDGVEKDLSKAREYFRKASDLGSNEAAQLLSTCE